MSNWRDRILSEFAPNVARLTLVADPDGFADEVAASLADPDAAATRAARGRIIAAEGYGWPALGARFAEVVTAVIGDRASRPHV